jgi:hypothetical protein
MVSIDLLYTKLCKGKLFIGIIEIPWFLIDIGCPISLIVINLLWCVIVDGYSHSYSLWSRMGSKGVEVP